MNSTYPIYNYSKLPRKMKKRWKKRYCHLNINQYVWYVRLGGSRRNRKTRDRILNEIIKNDKSKKILSITK